MNIYSYVSCWETAWLISSVIFSKANLVLVKQTMGSARLVTLISFCQYWLCMGLLLILCRLYIFQVVGP